MSKLVIVENGRSNYHIVGSFYADECERYAASELQKYIYEATEALVPYFSDICKKRGAEIIIGAKARDASARISEKELDSLGEEGFIIRTERDGTVIIAGQTSRGTLYGVYEFLERFLGFRAFEKDIEHIDKLEKLIIPSTKIKKTPDFEYRDAYFREAFDGELCAKLRLNTSVADISREKGGGMKFFSAHHSFESLLPSAKYFARHPEYYAFIDGERRASQPCLSNDEVVDIVTEEVLRLAGENPHARVFSVAQNDNSEYCKCERCRAVDNEEGSPSGSIIRFVNKVAERVERVYPKLLIHTFAYQYSRHAPRQTRPRQNVIVRLCNIECEWSSSFLKLAKKDPECAAAMFVRDIKEWTNICDRVYIWDYAVNFRNYLQPFPNFYQMAENIRFYRKMGIRGVLEEGNFSYGGGASLEGLKCYIIGKLLWDADSDVDTLIDEYLKGVFGKGAIYIKGYIDSLTACVEGHTLGIYDSPDAPYFTDRNIASYDLAFDLAELSAVSEKQRERVRREHLAVKYIKVCRISDDEERARAVDEFSKDVLHFRITELMERQSLYNSFEFMKRSRFAKDRDGAYTLYYVVK